jgi:hypothetical protein
LINLSNGLIFVHETYLTNFAEAAAAHVKLEAMLVGWPCVPHAGSLLLHDGCLRRNRGNCEDFAGFFVQDDGHVFVAGVEREEADFGFVETFGGEECF